MRLKLPIVRTVDALRSTVQGWRRRGKKIALVPTMGFLHPGHLSLVEVAKRNADHTVVSIFVNPTQFAPHEDFSTYPRDEEGDWLKLADVGTDLVYMPSVQEMYPDDFATRVEVAELTQGLCGAARPHHFAGVTTVVTKLFMQCLPDVAVFGEKDYQQLLVIRQLVRDLNLPITVLGGPTLREADGLAMSSRNAYLSDRERLVAPQLHTVLRDLAVDLSHGREVEEALAAGRSRLEAAGVKVEYLEVRSADRLIPMIRMVEVPARVFAAVRLGRVRLIDNMPVPERAEEEG